MLRLPRFKIVVFLVVLVFTFILRAHSYEKVPTSNHLDEMLYAWSGINLVETGVPVSWSTLPYPSSAQVYLGEVNYKGGFPKASVTLYKPWLDEPPLFSLLVGWFAHINGANRNEFIPSSYIRIPMVILGTLTSIFIFLIARKIGGYWRGILAMLVYSTVPIMVFASRTAMPENLIAFLLTLMVYLLMKFWDKPNFWYIAPIPLMIGIAGLSKPTGFMLLPLALYFTFAKLYKIGKLKTAIKHSLYLGIATIPFVLAYFWYGNHFDPIIFRDIYHVQSHRPVGFGSLSWFFTTPAVDTVVVRDSWFVFCLLSAAFFLFTAKDDIKRFVTISFIYSVLVVMFTGGENDLLAWYRFPSYPFLAILGAWGIEYIIQKANFFTTFFAAGMLLGGRMLLVNAFHPGISATKYRVALTALMLPATMYTIFNKDIFQKLSRVVIIGIVFVGMAMNSTYIYLAYEVECQNKVCPIVPSTTLSKLGFPFIGKLFYKYGK
jgi:4-amino-4-deoxy-L-arabinose transferase-like glycosyltransferase